MRQRCPTVAFPLLIRRSAIDNLSRALVDLAEAKIALTAAEARAAEAEARAAEAEANLVEAERTSAAAEARTAAVEELYSIALRVLEDARITETDLYWLRNSVDPVDALRRARKSPPPVAPPPIPTFAPPPIPQPPPIPSPPRLAISWTSEQEVALEEISAWLDSDEPFFSLTGPAGSGKTTLAREVVERLFSDSALAAMTGKAALRLSQLTGRPATTLHSILYYPPQPGSDLRFTRLREPPADVVLVDEGSMMTPSVFADLQNWGARVLLVGDTYQLPPVITGKEAEEHGEDYTVFGIVRGASLRTVMRSAGGVLRAATKVRETGEICEASDMDGDSGYSFLRCTNPLERAVDAYLEDPESHLVVTWRNASRMTANKRIRGRLGHDGPLPDAGEPVMIKRNTSGFLNGEVVTCAGFEDGPVVGSLRCLWMKVGEGVMEQKVLVSVDGREQAFDGGMPNVASWSKYHADLKRQMLPEPAPVTFGYVNTAHSAQGSEARRVTVFLERGDDRNQHFRKMTTLPDGSEAPFSARYVYTATTRGRLRATMLVGR